MGKLDVSSLVCLNFNAPETKPTQMLGSGMKMEYHGPLKDILRMLSVALKEYNRMAGMRIWTQHSTSICCSCIRATVRRKKKQKQKQSGDSENKVVNLIWSGEISEVVRQ